jgi:predicted RNA-binding protein with RPS1 domain
MSTTTELAKISLHGTNKGMIKISDITEPYGKGTHNVVSIGIALNGEDVEWKAHIPYENVDEVIEELKKAKANKQ